MDIDFSKRFKKQLRKLPKTIQNQFWKRLDMLIEGGRHPLLRDHELHGSYALCRSINITGDIRAIYTVEGRSILFLEIGSHSELYE